MTWKSEGTSCLHKRFPKGQDLATGKLTKCFANGFFLFFFNDEVAQNLTNWDIAFSKLIIKQTKNPNQNTKMKDEH